MGNYNETIIEAQEVEEYSLHLRPGTLLQKGKYKIVRFIKSGGFGCTYEAVNTTWKDRRVAIKELYVDDFCDRDHDRVTISTKSKKPLFEKLRNKFWDEANRINQLTHPGVVRVTDVFEENDTVYYVMDYIEGESLRDLIETKGRLPEAKVLYYMRQICEALQYVHDNKLMHLDIKPGNIMIDRAGDRAILIDFGVSRQYDEVGSANTSTLVPYTEGYAPIEQMGQNVVELGAATDIYAMGATLYHMLTGTEPPSANKLIKGLPVDSLQKHRVSHTTIRAIRTAMQADKNDRPQSVARFLSHLDGKQSGDHRWLWVAVVGVLIGVGVVFGLRGCGDHQGEAVSVADATEVVIDSAATSTTLPALTEEVLSEAMQKEQEQAERLVALEQENQRLKEQRRQDSIAAVKKAEEERQAKEAAAQAAREAEAARKAEEARKAAAASTSRGTINGHEWVDLGLSVKWATCNVGASSPSDWGSYYEWGETSTFDDNSVTWGKTFGDISGDSRYDAARKHWGGSWRMPTRAECEELKDKCTWTWTSQGGHAGYRVTGPNGNSIFLPASGFRYGSSLYGQGEYGYYWSSAPYESDTYYSYFLFFGSSHRLVDWNNRLTGRTVRPVSE